MNQREKSKEILKAYRHTTMVPATIAEPLRGALKGVIQNLASVEHLKDTISSMISSGYRENSPIMANLKTRLNTCEAQLVQQEAVLYGIIS